MPSNTECCFKNTVDRQIDIINRKEPATIHLCFFNRTDFDIAICAPMELKTWILGQTFVDVSLL